MIGHSNRKVGTRRGIAGLLVGWIMLIAAMPAEAQKFDPKSSIIVFGGFGYFDEVRLPWLSGLIRRDASGTSDFPDLGQQLETQVKAKAVEALSQGLGKWSSYPVIFDSAGLGAAYQKLTGSKGATTRERFARFDHAYLLVLSGGFEHDAIAKLSTASVGTGAVYYPYIFASVSASLIDLRSGNEIMLSAADLMMTENATDTAVVTRREWADRYAKAYALGAGNAIQRLVALAQKSDPGKRDASWDTYMVTGATIPARPDAKLAETVFDWDRSRPQKVAGPATFCRPANFCIEGSKACLAMTGLVASGLSRELSAKGYKVMPPMLWANSLTDVSQTTRLNLNLPASGLPELASSAEITFDPADASFKVIANVPLVEMSSKPLGNSGVASQMTVDSYAVAVAASAIRTDADDCSKAIGASFQDKTGTSSYAEQRPTSAAELDRDSQVIMYLRAINLAIQELGKRL